MSVKAKLFKYSDLADYFRKVVLKKRFYNLFIQFLPNKISKINKNIYPFAIL